MKSSIEKAREICKNNEIELAKEANILWIWLESYKRISANRYWRSPFNFITVSKK